MSYTSRVAEYMDFDGMSEEEAIARVAAERLAEGGEIGSAVTETGGDERQSTPSQVERPALSDPDFSEFDFKCDDPSDPDQVALFI